jgi:hypothetical protein
MATIPQADDEREREAYIRATIDAMPPFGPRQLATLAALFDYPQQRDSGDAA